MLYLWVFDIQDGGFCKTHKVFNGVIPYFDIFVLTCTQMHFKEKGSAWAAFLRQKDMLCFILEMNFYDWSKHKSGGFLIETHAVTSSVMKRQSQQRFFSFCKCAVLPFNNWIAMLDNKWENISLCLADVSLLLLGPEHVWFNLDRHKHFYD